MPDFFSHELNRIDVFEKKSHELNRLKTSETMSWFLPYNVESCRSPWVGIASKVGMAKVIQVYALVCNGCG